MKHLHIVGGENNILVKNLPDGAAVEYSNNAKIDVGTYEVTAVIKAKENTNYTGSVELYATLKIVAG